MICVKIFACDEARKSVRLWRIDCLFFFGEFDSGSERTLAAWIRHASRTEIRGFKPQGENLRRIVAKG